MTIVKTDFLPSSSHQKSRLIGFCIKKKSQRERNKHLSNFNSRNFLYSWFLILDSWFLIPDNGGAPNHRRWRLLAACLRILHYRPWIRTRYSSGWRKIATSSKFPSSLASQYYINGLRSWQPLSCETAESKLQNERPIRPGPALIDKYPHFCVGLERKEIVSFLLSSHHLSSSFFRFLLFTRLVLSWVMGEVCISDVDAVASFKPERAILAYYVTGHGLGHATRVVEVDSIHFPLVSPSVFG